MAKQRHSLWKSAFCEAFERLCISVFGSVSWRSVTCVLSVSNVHACMGGWADASDGIQACIVLIYFLNCQTGIDSSCKWANERTWECSYADAILSCSVLRLPRKSSNGWPFISPAWLLSHIHLFSFIEYLEFCIDIIFELSIRPHFSWWHLG